MISITRFVGMLAVGLVALGGAGCLHDNRPTRERGLTGGGAPVQDGPEKDRCQAMPKGADKRTCEENRTYALERSRKLAVGDAVCLEGDVLEEPNEECVTRAVVMDVANDRALIEIRAARPESRWFNDIQSQRWFTERALVDLYLGQRGF